MTLLVKDANTTVQSLATEVDGNGNLVPLHAPASTNAQGVSTPVGPQNPLPVINTAGSRGERRQRHASPPAAARRRCSAASVPANGFLVQNNSSGGAVDFRCRRRLGRRRQHPARGEWRDLRDAVRVQAGRCGQPLSAATTGQAFAARRW